MAGVPTYASREDVKSAAQITTARDDLLVDDALDAGSRDAESLLHRRFYPWTGTRYFDWPARSQGTSWRLWLDDNELASLTTLKVSNGATTLAASTYFLRRSDNKDEAPYDQVQLDLGGTGVFSAGTTTQRALELTGVYIGCPVRTVRLGTVAEVLDASETDVDVSNSAAVGAGDLVLADSEYMIVTDRAMLSTGQTVQTAGLTASQANTTLLVTSGAALNVRETLLIDAERLRVVDIAGNTATVERAQDGTVLAAHSIGATIYAPRTLTVERGALGTTAASHLTATVLYKHAPPKLVKALTVAYAINQLQQQGAAYARIIGAGDNAREFTGRGIRELERDARAAHGRSMRARAI